MPIFVGNQSHRKGNVYVSEQVYTGRQNALTHARGITRVLPANGRHANDGATDRRNNTTTPIKHVIVIIGENRSFDHVFATYQPRHGQLIWNLLSEGIINADGTPGPDFSKALQMSATDQASDQFLLNPPEDFISK
jgi:phospholipase C